MEDAVRSVYRGERCTYVLIRTLNNPAPYTASVPAPAPSRRPTNLQQNVDRQSVCVPSAAAYALRHTTTTQYYLLGDVHGPLSQHQPVDMEDYAARITNLAIFAATPCSC